MFAKYHRFLFIFLAVVSLSTSPVFAAAPTLTAFSPTSGKLGTKVTITGTNFVAPLTVAFNGVNSSVTVVSTTQVTAFLPIIASTGKINLTTSGGSVTSAGVFTVVPGLSVNIASGPPATSCSLSCSGFGAYEAIDFYFDTATIGLASASGSGSATLASAIPASATSGTHWLTAVGRHSGYSAQISFLVRCDWPQSGYSPSHQNNNPYENILASSTVYNLQEAWRTLKIGSMMSTPSVLGGVVYATFGDGSVRAFNELTGAPKWTAMLGGGTMFSSPAVAGGIVYVGSSDNALYALDAATGARKWRYATGDIVYGSPTVKDGVVYFGSYDKKVYAVNATTGSLIWSYATGAAVFSTPAVANGVVYVGSFDSSVYAFNATTGAKIWQTATTGLILASPVVSGGLICVGSEDKIMYALRASTGAIAWKYTTTGVIDSTAALIGSTLYFGTTDGKVYAVSGGGAVIWVAYLPSAFAVRGPVCAANGIVYASDGAYTYALAQNNGAQLTTLPVGSNYGGPVVLNGALLMGDSFDGVLTRYTLSAPQGMRAAQRPTASQLRAVPLN